MRHLDQIKFAKTRKGQWYGFLYACANDLVNKSDYTSKKQENNSVHCYLVLMDYEG